MRREEVATSAMLRIRKNTAKAVLVPGTNNFLTEPLCFKATIIVIVIVWEHMKNMNVNVHAAR